jgi:hypothetical protein
VVFRSVPARWRENSCFPPRRQARKGLKQDFQKNFKFRKQPEPRSTGIVRKTANRPLSPRAANFDDLPRLFERIVQTIDKEKEN